MFKVNLRLYNHPQAWGIPKGHENPKYFLKYGVKGQAWGMDLMIATMIFSLALVSFYLYSFNVGDFENDLESLSFDGRIITNTLLSSGSPEDWTEFNVVELGILTDDEINETKLWRFYNFSRDNYTQTKSVFNTVNDYYFFFESNMTFGTVEVEGIGKPGIDKDNISSNNLVKIERIVVYKNKPIGAKLYVWN